MRFDLIGAFSAVIAISQAFTGQYEEDAYLYIHLENEHLSNGVQNLRNFAHNRNQGLESNHSEVEYPDPKQMEFRLVSFHYVSSAHSRLIPFILNQAVSVLCPEFARYITFNGYVTEVDGEMRVLRAKLQSKVDFTEINEELAAKLDKAGIVYKQKQDIGFELYREPVLRTTLAMLTHQPFRASAKFATVYFYKGKNRSTGELLGQQNIVC